MVENFCFISRVKIIYKMTTFKDHSNFILCNNHKNNIGYSIKNFHRVLFFTKSEDKNISIDFVSLKIYADKLYIIPSGHILYLPTISQDFYCINFDSSTLTQLENLWIFSKKYSTEKIINRPFSLNEYSSIQKISDIFDYDFIKKVKKIPEHYIFKAKLINNFFLSHNICHKTTIGVVSKNIHVTDKTLLRICKSIYQCNPRDIIQYHLASKCFLYLLHNNKESIVSIAYKFNFEEVSTFTRYIKSYIKHTPKDIKKFSVNFFLLFYNINYGMSNYVNLNLFFNV